MMVFAPYRIATALIIINVVGGVLALAAARGSSPTGGSDGSIYTTYILGLFLVNGIHGLMHLIIGLLGLFARALKIRPDYYLMGHSIWFLSLGLLGLVAAPELTPPRAILGLAINLPDHVAHLVLAATSLVPFLLTAGRGLPATSSSM